MHYIKFQNTCIHVCMKIQIHHSFAYLILKALWVGMKYRCSFVSTSYMHIFNVKHLLYLMAGKFIFYKISSDIICENLEFVLF